MQQVYAHRGASGYAPENTLEAFALAMEQGAHGVELDVHLTRDGEIVVTHDERIDRVTGQRGDVARMTLAELKRIRFNLPHPEYDQATIPTLREVYELLGPSGMGVNVELKNTHNPYPGLEEKCLDLAREMGMEGRVLYSSFNHASMGRVKRIDPSVRCGLLYDAILDAPWLYAHTLLADALHPSYRQLYAPSFVEDAHREGLAVNPWTVNDAATIGEMFAFGADIVITNYPDVALEVLGGMVEA